MKKLLLFLLLCTLSVVELHAQQKPTIVLLMRHAEKATSGGADPELSDKGKEFADRLNLHFSELRIDAVYSTNYKRTRQTVEPLAKRSALEIKTYDPSKSSDLVKRIQESSDQVVVISGHSNTINLVFNELVKSTQISALRDDEYGKVFLIYFDKTNPANSAYVKMKL